MQPCEHHTTGPRPSCSDLGEPETPACEKKCIKSYKKPFKKDHHFGKVHWFKVESGLLMPLQCLLLWTHLIYLNYTIVKYSGS